MFNKHRKATVILSAAAIAMLLVSACAPAVAPTAQLTPKPAVETPKYGGVFTAYSTTNPSSLDAHQEPSINTSMLISPAYNTLIQYDPETGTKVVPGLAEKWEISKDGLTWSFQVRKGVKFHDGKPVTVADVQTSFERMWTPPKGVLSNLSFLLGPVVEKIEASGDTFKIVLKYPYAPLTDILSMDYFPIYPKHVVEEKGDMKTTVVGTGPFKYKDFTPGVSMELVKNPDYWVKGRPYLDGVSYLIIRDAATRLAAFRTGKVHRTGRIFAIFTPTDMETLKKENPELTFHEVRSVLGPWFMMNTRVPPFKDVRVRKAISLALDRQAALKVVAEGHGQLSTVFPSPLWGLPDAELLKLPGYRQPKDADMAEAKKLMADAGYPTGFKLTVLARTMPMSKDSAVFMTSQLAKLGIEAKVEVLEDAIFWDRGRKAQHEAMVYTPAENMTDPIWHGRYWFPGSPLNFSGNDDDKKLIEMWEKQIRIMDVEERKKAIMEVERHLLETVPGISIVWPYTYMGAWPTVRGWSPGVSDYHQNTLQEVWLAK